MRSKPITTTTIDPPPTKWKEKIGKTTHNRTIDRYSLSHLMFRTYNVVIHPSLLEKPAAPTYCVPSYCAKYSRSLNLHFILDVCDVCVVFFSIALSIRHSSTARQSATAVDVGREVCVFFVSFVFFCLPFHRIFRQTIR